MARKNRINICAIISILMIISGIIYVIVCTMLNLHRQWMYRLVFAVWVSLYMILTDFIEPLATDRFRRKNRRQVKAYYRYVVLDIIGMAGLLWFVCMSGMFDDYTHYAGIVVFIACIVPKNHFYKKYNAKLSYYERREDEEEDDDFDIDISDN